MPRIVLCEGDPLFHADLEEWIAEFESQSEPPSRPEVLLSTGSARAVEHWIDSNSSNGSAFADRPLVFLLGIRLPEGSDAGIDLAEKARARFPHAYIVFATDQLQQAFRVFQSRPFDLLPRPVTRERLTTLFYAILHHFSKRGGLPAPAISDPSAAAPDVPRAPSSTSGPDDVLQVRSAGLIYRIRRDAIRCVERVDDRTHIHEEGRTIACATSIERIEQELQDSDGLFLRIHRRTLVNLRAVVDFNPASCLVTIAGGRRLEVGRNYVRLFQERWKP